MSVSSLRGFPAPAMSFLTGPPNLISANPNVLVRGGRKKKKNQQGPADNKAPEESSAPEKRSFCSLFVRADVDWDNQRAEKDTVSLMNLS